MQIFDVSSDEKVVVEKGAYALRVPKSWHVEDMTTPGHVKKEAWITPVEFDYDTPRLEIMAVRGRLEEERLGDLRNPTLRTFGLVKEGGAQHYITFGNKVKKPIMINRHWQIEDLHNVLGGDLNSKEMATLRTDSTLRYLNSRKFINISQLSITDNEGIVFHAEYNASAYEYNLYIQDVKKILDSLILHASVK